MGKAKDAAYAYIDGSYNYDTNRYGCGGILSDKAGILGYLYPR